MQLSQYGAMRNGWTDEAFQRFWKRMGETFGKSWYEQNGPEPNTTWQASLLGMALDQVAFAIEHFRKSGDAFPPNLSQFIAVAKQLKIAPAHVSLPKPKSEPTKIDKYLSQIRKALDG